MHPTFLVIVLVHAALLALFTLGIVRFLRARRAGKLRSPRLAIAALVALGAGLALSAYAFGIEPRRLVVERVSIASPGWHGAPLRIVALGDIHVAGPHMSPARARDVVAEVDALAPDLVVLLGDYVHGHERLAASDEGRRRAVTEGITALGGLRAPLGVVAVLGNHDVWYDREHVERALRDASITVLVNAHTVIDRGGAPLVIAGLDDATTGSPDYALALRGAPEAADVIVLTHSPDPFATSPPGVALTLAAHTHCGQVYVPFVGRAVVPSAFGQRFACGLVRERDQALYVTAGLGTSILPVRFLTPPEISLLTLTAAD